MVIAAGAAASLLAVPALARETAWMALGVRPISATTPSLTIDLSGTNVPRETMFCVDDAAVQIVTAEFRFRTGDPQTLNVRARLRAGACSRAFSLRNREAELATVVVTADPASVPAGSTARVRVLVR